jgi:hypothetical protein
MVRGGVCLVLLVFGVGAGPGCGSSSKPSPSPLNCTRSVEEYCSAISVVLVCPPTWNDVEAGQVMCVAGELDYSYEIWDCGNYRRLTYRGTDSGASLYYDAASGQLVAVVEGGLGVEACAAGPPGGFEIPTCQYADGGFEQIDCGRDGNR